MKKKKKENKYLLNFEKNFEIIKLETKYDKNLFFYKFFIK